MPWQFSFTALNKDEAHAKVAAEREKNEHVPAKIAESVDAAIDALPDGLGVSVSSNGHIDASSANASLTVGTVSA